jgi:hypothetical protein
MSARLDAAEATANATIGLALSVLAVQVAWPFFGWSASLSQSLAVTGLFWGLSVARGFVVRRVFRRLSA